MINMKYPILKVKEVPRNYKHCGVYQCATIHFGNEEAFINGIDDDIKQKYLHEMMVEIVETIDNNFIICQCANVLSNHQYFILFKSNLDVRAFQIFTHNLLKEAKAYVACDMKMYLALFQVMVFQEGKDFGILSSSKAGSDLFEEGQLARLYKEVDVSNVAGHAKYLTSFEEFKAQHAAQADYYCI